MPTQIATSSVSTATAYSNQRKIDRTSNGVLWTFYTAASGTGTPGRTLSSYSTDDGVTWNSGTPLAYAAASNYVANSSFFIDIDDYAHVVYKNPQDGYIYYVRGTPDAGRTTWTWSAAWVVYNGDVNGDYPDVVAHREGTGWIAHVVLSSKTSNADYLYYVRMTITSAGSISKGTLTIIGGVYSNTVHKYPSIDFNHTGDGKTVAGGTPHLYAAWSAGSTGAGKGIRFKKATYSAGAWTWGTEREIDPNKALFQAHTSGWWLNCLFDGTRVIIPGLFYNSGSDADLTIYERDAADTTTTVRSLFNDPAALVYRFYGSASYDSKGNVYIFGIENDSVAPYDFGYYKWNRSDGLLVGGSLIEVDTGNGYPSARRGYINDEIEFVFTVGTASPYTVMYGRVDQSVALTPVVHKVVSASSVASNSTIWGNQRKVDRTSNGVLWALCNNAGTSTQIFETRYSIDEGVTWIVSGSGVQNGSGATSSTYTRDGSFFIDVDDYAHVVFKDNSNGQIYYRRGTPNLDRTSWTWSAAFSVYAANLISASDIVVHREGTGWVAHLVMSYLSGSNNYAVYKRILISSSGTLTLEDVANLGGSYSVSNHTWPSIDFYHTGDGKTVKDGTPHLFVAWTAGATGASKGIRFCKITYSAGVWTVGPERGIDSTRQFPLNSSQWLLCMFDGTRVIMFGEVISTTYDTMLYERDVADTITTTTLISTTTGVSRDRLAYGSGSYDKTGNLYLFGNLTDEASGQHDLVLRKWDRKSGSYAAAVVLDPTIVSAYTSVKRGWSDNKVEILYTDGTASPYTVMFSSISTPSITWPRVRGVIVGGVEVAAHIRGVIIGGIEKAARVRGVIIGGVEATK